MGDPAPCPSPCCVLLRRLCLFIMIFRSIIISARHYYLFDVTSLIFTKIIIHAIISWFLFFPWQIFVCAVHVVGSRFLAVLCAHQTMNRYIIKTVSLQFLTAYETIVDRWHVIVTNPEAMIVLTSNDCISIIP